MEIETIKLRGCSSITGWVYCNGNCKDCNLYSMTAKTTECISEEVYGKHTTTDGKIVYFGTYTGRHEI